jgi:putative transcriptional regulator
MGSKAFDKIARGLREAIAYVGGDTTGAVVHEAQDIDVGAVREKTGLLQEEFARTFGVSIGTLRNWEQGRRTPDGPARVLLTLIDRDPISILKTLRGVPAKRPARAARRRSTGSGERGEGRSVLTRGRGRGIRVPHTRP